MTLENIRVRAPIDGKVPQGDGGADSQLSPITSHQGENWIKLDFLNLHPITTKHAEAEGEGEERKGQGLGRKTFQHKLLMHFHCTVSPKRRIVSQGALKISSNGLSPNGDVIMLP